MATDPTLAYEREWRNIKLRWVRHLTYDMHGGCTISCVPTLFSVYYVERGIIDHRITIRKTCTVHYRSQDNNMKLCDEYLGALSGDQAPKTFGTQNEQAASIPLTPFVCAAVATRRPSFGTHQIQIIASLNVKPTVPSFTLTNCTGCKIYFLTLHLGALYKGCAFVRYVLPIKSRTIVTVKFATHSVLHRVQYSMKPGYHRWLVSRSLKQNEMM